MEKNKDLKTEDKNKSLIRRKVYTQKPKEKEFIKNFKSFLKGETSLDELCGSIKP